MQKTALMTGLIISIMFLLVSPLRWPPSYFSLPYFPSVTWNLRRQQGHRLTSVRVYSTPSGFSKSLFGVAYPVLPVSCQQVDYYVGLLFLLMHVKSRWSIWKRRLIN